MYVPVCMYVTEYFNVLNYIGRSGIPAHTPAVELTVNSRVRKINQSLLPSSAQAIREYEESGGRITDPDCTQYS